MRVTSLKTFTMLMLLQFCTALSASVMPAAAMGSVVILSHVGYLDSEGNYRVVGEVQNTGAQAVNFTQVTATFYDSSGALIDTRFDLTMIYDVLPNRKSPFEIALLDVMESSRVHHYSLSLTFQESTPIPLGISVLSHYSYKDADDQMHIIGYIKNVGSERAESVVIVATYYDSSGRVAAVGLASLDPEITEPLDPNVTQPFEILLTQERTVYVNTYLLSATSYQYAITAELFNPRALTIPGDVNNDGVVNILDAAAVSAHWYPGPPIGPLGYAPYCDINNDGAISILDAAILSAHWTG